MFGDWSSTTASTSGFDYFYIKFADKDNSYNYDDGLLVTSVSAKHNDTWYTQGYFSEGSGLSCTGCDFWGDYCNSCWLDGDGHGDCKEIKTEADAPYDAWCL